MVDKIASSVTEMPGTISHLRKQEWRELGLHFYIKLFIIGGLFVCLFRNEISAVVNKWLTDSSWSHGFLIPGFSLYFINQHKKEILSLYSSGHVRPNYLGLALLILAISFYLFNKISPSGYAYFRYLSVIMALGAIVLFLSGWSLVRYLWLPVVFLIFAVPLPQRYYVSLTMPMRHLAASVASNLLSLVNAIEATATGVIIEVFYNGNPVPPLNVAEACSGMRLLMAFLALGVAMAYLHYRPIWQRLVLLACTIPIAVACNVVRVTVTGFIYVLVHPKYTQGIYHDALGLVMLPLAFALYGFLAWFMSSLFIDETEVVKEDIVVRKHDA